MIEIILAVTVVFTLLLAGGVVWLLRARAALARQAEDHLQRNEALRQAVGGFETDLAVARTTQQNLEDQLRDALGRLESATQLQRDELRKLHEEKSALALRVERLDTERESLMDLRKKLDETMSGVATRSLKESGEQFLALAKKTFEKEQGEASASLEQRRIAIDEMLKPIRQTLEKHARAVEEVEKQRATAYGSLRQHLTQLHESHDRLGKQTTALATALRGSSSQRGQWGEMTLRRIAEMAGMARHCDFAEQVTAWSGDAQQRPDMVVHLPANRQVVVDAKSVGQAYLEACEAEDEPTRDRLMKQHLRDIKGRVGELAAKAYTDALPNSVDFVVLFMPGESFLYAAAAQDPQLLEHAMNRGIVIATPTTLVSLLKVVEMGWRQERVAESAKQIQALGQELHSRVGTLTGHVEKLGKSLNSSTQHYNKLVGSFESQVLVQARRFKELGAGSSKELPAEDALPAIEVQTRELRSLESAPE